MVSRTPDLLHSHGAANLNVFAISTKGRDVPFHVPLQATEQSGLTSTSFAKCEQVLTISKERLESRLGAVSERELAEVDEALRLVLDL